MKKTITTLSLFCASLTFAQNNLTVTSGAFDPIAAKQEAVTKGIQPSDYNGYIAFKQREWNKQNTSVTLNPSNNIIAKVGSVSALPSNIDFENGNYNGWNTLIGENLLSSFGALSNIRAVSPWEINKLPNVCGVDTARHGIMTDTIGFDPYCNVPLSSPLGGSHIARLNRYCAGSQGAILEQTFTVGAGATILNYAYLVVLQDGGHMQGEQSYFSSYALDINGDTIPNSKVYAQANNGFTPGFNAIASDPYTFYKTWTPVSIDFSAYVGQDITVRFIAADCIYGGHSGYAYVDAKMDSVSNVPNVWPGDANYDLSVDMNDLLYIGWAYGSTGTTRASASNNWIAQPSVNWAQITPYGTDYKHTDCNGDGVISLDDTLALVTNYSLNHVFKTSNTKAVNSLTNYRNVILSSTSTNVGVNQQFNVSLDMPSCANSIENMIYGITFRLNIPQQYINTLNSNDYLFSLVGTNGLDMITLSKPNLGAGYIDYCLVRNNHINSNGVGKLMSLSLNSNNFTSSGIGQFSISNLKVVTKEGCDLLVGSNVLDIPFNLTTGISQLTANEYVKIFPNPATSQIAIQGFDMTKYEVIDVLGRLVLNSVVSEKNSIDISSINKGAYILKLYNADKVITKKFIKE
jgi:hypothetical protein